MTVMMMMMMNMMMMKVDGYDNVADGGKFDNVIIYDNER